MKNEGLSIVCNDELKYCLKCILIEVACYKLTLPLAVLPHAAGPTIGLWDQQGGVPGSGDFPLNYKTAYSIELNAASDIPE